MVRRWGIGMLALLLCGILGYESAWAQAVPAQPGTSGMTQIVGGEERVLPGEYTETPEDIIVAALELYSWFTISPLDVDPDLISADGFLYRVADEELCRNDVMMQLLSDTFSAQVIEEMMMYEVYTVIDGMLYTTAGGGRGIDQNISFVEYEEIYSDEQKIVYRVVVHYHGEAEFYMLPDEFEFVREKIEDKWLFTQFTFFW